MPMQRYSDQQVPLNSKIHNSLRRPNPPILKTHIIPVLVRNETQSMLGSPPSLRLRSGQAQPSPIKGEGVLTIDLVSIISNCKRYYLPIKPLRDWITGKS
jgi:hypothetical protein